MTKTKQETLVIDALPGEEVNTEPLLEDIEKPWLIWNSNSVIWAIYLISGDTCSSTTEKAIKKLKSSNMKPCLCVQDGDSLRAVAKPFINLHIPVITEIGGKGVLLIPPAITLNASPSPTALTTRVPLSVLKACHDSATESNSLRNCLRQLIDKYASSEENWSDDLEQEALREFFLSFSKANGLSDAPELAQQALRKFELGSMRGSRDHYFHSFQNFFLGLWPVLESKAYFRKWTKVSKLQWEVAPEFIWFLVTLWHDVGYTIKYRHESLTDTYGIEMDDSDSAELSSYLSSQPVQEAKQQIASLMVHLQKTYPSTSWMIPTSSFEPTPSEERIELVISGDIRKGHSAASSLRLYTDMHEFMANCATQEKRLVLQQSVLLAAASIPLHDWKFRKRLRDEDGKCKIPALTMPFAVLLAFVDSLQEDRRQPSVAEDGRPFLRELALDDGRVIGVEVDISAIESYEVLFKIVEANDVNASVKCTTRSIEVRYPAWMVQ